MRIEMYKNLPAPISSADTIALIRAGEREQAVLCNVRLVFLIVQRYKNTGCDTEDLVQSGIVGLIKAVDAFDCDKGYCFSTFAARCITNEILMFLRQFRKHRNTVHLSDVISEDNGKEVTLEDAIAGDIDVCEEITDRTMLKEVWDTVETLDSQERTIILLRYGKREESQTAIARKFGLSQSYVSRAEKKAIEKLRGRLHV